MASEEHLAHQNEQVVTFTLVELLTSFVFISMALAIVLADEARDEILNSLDPKRREVLELRTRVETAEALVAKQGRRIAYLERELAAARDLNNQLIAAQSGTLPPPATVTVKRSNYDRMSTAADVTAGQQLMIAGLQAEIAKLRGGGKVDFPPCTTHSGALIFVRANSGGTLTVSRAWPAPAWVNLQHVDGLRELADAGTVTLGQFSRLAAPVARWGERQAVPCRFRANIQSTHGNLKAYLRQESIVVSRFRTIRAG